MQVVEIADKKVADLVTENINNAHVFKKYGIDFCCGGGISVQRACDKHDVDISQITDELNANNEAKQHFNYTDWDLSFLSKTYRKCTS